ncbi:MAG: fructosamine kinase [Ardenticatenia bacterium]|nr:MAG: fructosamine kinase [Ardenticatenia bacterium]
MAHLPNQLREQIEQHLGTAITRITPVGGGDINQAARLETAGDVFFLKWHAAPPPGMFAAEADGLRRIAATHTVRVPHVIAQGDTWLLLEWLPIGRRTAAAAKRLGEALATLHRHTAAHYGLEHDNYIGLTPQINHPETDWVRFWREHRLRPQMRLAAERGRMPTHRRRALERLIARLDEWLPRTPPASLLHGDLWGGNWVALEDGTPALIDPAVYHGDRETDIAFTHLFGGFPASFYDAYTAAWPLPPGADARRDLYNLYHLLNHLNLFGEAYGASVDHILARYVGQ